MFESHIFNTPTVNTMHAPILHKYKSFHYDDEQLIWSRPAMFRKYIIIQQLHPQYIIQLTNFNNSLELGMTCRLGKISKISNMQVCNTIGLAYSVLKMVPWTLLHQWLHTLETHIITLIFDAYLIQELLLHYQPLQHLFSMCLF